MVVFNRLISRLLVLVFVAAVIANGWLWPANASADILYNRSVIISTAQASAAASHDFQFDIPSTVVLGSIVMEYCDNAPSFYLACNPPAGLNVSGATLTSQTGNTGFSIDNAVSTANKIVLTRPPAAGSIAHSSYNFSGIINPSTRSPSIFVKISTYSTTDGSGSYTNNGAVAFAILGSSFQVGAYVPPFLQLCVGISVAPDCSSITGDSLDLGILSSKRANYGQSQFVTATNDPTGYNVYAVGPTMTSGNNIITSLDSPTPSFPGTPQFGMNLRANIIPAVGQDPVGLGTAAPAPNYNLQNRFLFVSGDSITSSTTTTNYNRMTVSYLVNIPSNQPPGVYATSITYIATVQF